MKNTTKDIIIFMLVVVFWTAISIATVHLLANIPLGIFALLVGMVSLAMVKESEFPYDDL